MLRESKLARWLSRAMKFLFLLKLLLLRQMSMWYLKNYFKKLVYLPCKFRNKKVHQYRNILFNFLTDFITLQFPTRRNHFSVWNCKFEKSKMKYQRIYEAHVFSRFYLHDKQLYIILTCFVKLFFIFSWKFSSSWLFIWYIKLQNCPSTKRKSIYNNIQS